MRKHPIYYSQFLRELTFNGLWLDFWIIALTLITFIIAPLIIENPFKTISTLFITRAFMTGEISLEEVKGNGIEVLTEDRTSTIDY